MKKHKARFTFLVDVFTNDPDMRSPMFEALVATGMSKVIRVLAEKEISLNETGALRWHIKAPGGTLEFDLDERR